MQLLQRFAAACAVALVCSPAAAQFSVGAGVEYTVGKFGGTENTHNLHVPFSARYDTERWSFKATIPYVVVSGPGNTLGVGADRVPLDDGDNSGSGSSGSGSGGSGGSSDDDEDSGSTRRTTSGLGDIVLSAFRIMLDERSAGIGLDLGAKVKLGTGDREERLGTGENDYSVQADLYKPIGALTVFGSLGYRWFGDPPGIELKDVPYWALGASYRASSTSTVGASYDYRRPILPGGSALSEITAFVVNRLSQGWRLQFYALVGLSDASPDAGAGMNLQYRFE